MPDSVAPDRKPGNQPDPFADLALGRAHGTAAQDKFADIGLTPARRPVLNLTPAPEGAAARPLSASAAARERLAARPDATRTRNDPNPQARRLGTVARGLTMPLEMGAAALEHPLQTATELVVAPARAAKTAAAYAGQKAAELTLPAGLRAEAEQDPERIHGSDAAIAAAQVASMVAAPAVSKLVGGITRPLLSEAGEAVGHMAAGGLAGAAWMPDDPVAGAIGGAAMALPFAGGAVARVGDVSEGVVERAARQMAAEGRGPSPVPEHIQNANFARLLEQGAADMPWNRRPATPPPLAPDAQATADFAAVLEQPVRGRVAAAAPAGFESAADLVARRAEVARRGIRRRPGRATPEDLPPEPVAVESPPDPFADLAVAPTRTEIEPIPSIGEAVSFGRDPLEPSRVPTIAGARARGGLEVPGVALTRDAVQALDEGRHLATTVANPQALEFPVERQAAALLGDRDLPPASAATKAEFLAGLSEADRQFIQNDPQLGRLFDLPDVPVGAPRPLRPSETLLNPRGYDPALAGAVQEAEGALQARGVTKMRVPTADGLQRVRAMTREALVEMGMDPTSMDLRKVGRLTGEEIVAFRGEATRLMDEVTAISKQLADPRTTPQDASVLQEMLEKAQAERDAVLDRVVTASSQKGRDLAFLRQIAHRSLDPDVWVVQARRLAGDRPLSDEVVANIRRLARETAEACALGG